MSEERFNRLENKVDKVDEKVNEVKLEVSEMRSDIHENIRVVQDHVTSDNKIIEHIKPLVPVIHSLSEMVEDYSFRKKMKYRRMERLKTLSIKVGIIAALSGIVFGYLRYLS